MIIEGENQKSKTEMEISQNEYWRSNLKNQISTAKVHSVKRVIILPWMIIQEENIEDFLLKEIHERQESEDENPGLANQG